jgi:hypothetical protein
VNPSTAFEIARGLLDLVLKLVPAPAAAKLLDEQAQARAMAIGELADDAKFGPEK